MEANPFITDDELRAAADATGGYVYQGHITVADEFDFYPSPDATVPWALMDSDLEDRDDLAIGQADSLKYDDGETRVWLSRCTVEDGEPCNDKVTIERNQGGSWREVLIAQAF